ncbi:MAG: RagB/SusD family nutrient uptake outer membrane protein [Bacteroidaceae bacterium]|nr:RagB/SusD family nutrient uptake outer membrane protein [Bacteroidaceae bacterium]
MKLKNIIKSIGLAILSSLPLVSCDVEVLPLNQIIAQNYWTSKADVESVVFSCYTGLTSSDVITRMIIWGEVRSDNIKEGQQISQASKDLQYLLNGNILETNTYCDFSAFYKLINRCNTVELYAPVIQERDPNYTESDLRQNLAEVKAIRALCYFYLIRTFGDVPFTFVASIDDDQNYYLPATKQELILDTLIMDLEANVNYAPKRYVNEIENSARISRNAINAILADMYLWRASNANVAPATRNADYLKCVEYCDKVIDAKIAEYKEDRYGTLRPQISRDIYAYYGFPLLEEWAESDQTSGVGTNAKAFNKIFGGDGNSFESIFELNFEEESHRYGSSNENSVIGSLYGGRNSRDNGAQLAANDIMMSQKPGANYEANGLFSSYDFRSQTSFLWHESNPYTIQKYVVESSRVKVGAYASWSVDGLNNSARQENYANWILYRLTDIMLMKAEAEVQIAAYLDENVTATTDDGTTTTTPAPRRIIPTGNVYSTAKEYYDDAFDIVRAINDRSTPQIKVGTQNTSRPQRSNFNIKKDFDLLVENERRRELLFEGKRYYDLVRRARREGNTTYVAGLLSNKFTQNSSAMRIKMAMIEFLYMPFSEDELKRNPLLVQNPAFDKEKKNTINY